MYIYEYYVYMCTTYTKYNIIQHYEQIIMIYYIYENDRSLTINVNRIINEILKNIYRYKLQDHPFFLISCKFYY
jgi:hypothetical protein